MDQQERDQIIAKTTADVAGLLDSARRERDVRRADGRDVAWLEQVIQELEPLARHLHDVTVGRSIRAVVERHGPGPYPVEDLAAFTQYDPGVVQRVLDDLVAAGLATPPTD